MVKCCKKNFIISSFFGLCCVRWDFFQNKGLWLQSHVAHSKCLIRPSNTGILKNSQLWIYNSIHAVPNICLCASVRNLTTSLKPTRSHQIFGPQGELGLLEVHAITTGHAPPRPPSSLLPLIPFPSGPVSWHTPTPAPPVNTLWLQGSVFPNLCNCVTHSLTHTHTRVCKLKKLGRVSGSAQPPFIRSK